MPKSPAITACLEEGEVILGMLIAFLAFFVAGSTFRGWTDLTKRGCARSKTASRSSGAGSTPLEARPWLVRAQDRFGAWLVRQSPPVWVLLMTVIMLVSITFVALWGRVLHWLGVI